MERHLYKLAKASKRELREVEQFGNKALTAECKEIFQDAREAWEIIKKYEPHGLEEEQVNRIRTLLQRIMALEKLVGQQIQGMTRREVIQKGFLATAAAHLFGVRAFAQGQTTYIIFNTNYEVNVEFMKQVISQEQEILGDTYVVRYNGTLMKMNTPQLVNYSQEISSEIGRFFQYFYEGLIFKDSKEKILSTVRGELLPSKDYRIIFVSDEGSTPPTEEEGAQIARVMKERNIEVYVFSYLAQNPNFPPRDINSFKLRVENRWNFATKVYTTPNLDRSEFRRVIQEWKR